MANCPPVERGLIDFAYDKISNNGAVAFEGYSWKDYQAAAIRAELRDLVKVLDPKAPPWKGDETATAAVFRRKIPSFGTIWYTFVLINHVRFLFVLTGTCEGVDDRRSAVRRARQEAAKRRVDELRRDGSLCVDDPDLHN